MASEAGPDSSIDASETIAGEWRPDGPPSGSAATFFDSLLSYDLATGAWKDESAAPSVKYPHAAGRISTVWSGRELLFYGGMNGHVCCAMYADGAIFRP